LPFIQLASSQVSDSKPPSSFLTIRVWIGFWLHTTMIGKDFEPGLVNMNAAVQG
jgi:hypothetical protein